MEDGPLERPLNRHNTNENAGIVDIEKRAKSMYKGGDEFYGE